MQKYSFSPHIVAVDMLVLGAMLGCVHRICGRGQVGRFVGRALRLHTDDRCHLGIHSFMLAVVFVH